MSRIRAGDVLLNVQQLGPADGAATVVLLHGLLTDSLASWYFSLGRPLAEAGLRVVMFDLRGHGRSERPPTGYRLEDFAGDLSALLTVVAPGGPVHLIGNSFGGTVAAGFAADAPDRVASLALIESGPATGGWAARMAGTLDQAAAQLSDDEAIERIRDRHGAAVARRGRLAGRLLASTSLARDVPASRLPTPAQLAAVRCPVLGIYAGDSDWTFQAPLLHHQFPRTRTVLVPGQPHTVLVDRPDLIGEILLPWLGEQRASLGAESR